MNEPTIVKLPTKTATPVQKFHAAILNGKLHKIWDIATVKGFCIDTLNEYGQTGLFCAAYKGLIEVVALLLSLGAKPNARCQPEGYTPVHGACYFGSTRILKLLLQASGDLRLCDNQRRTPMSWCLMQMDSMKVQAIRKVIEGARVCTLKNNGVDMLKEIQDILSPRHNRAFLEKVRKNLRRNGRTVGDFNLTLELSGGIHFTGFGQAYYGSGRKCGHVIGLPCISDIMTDLENEKDVDAPSWICGKFTEFTPKLWVSSKTPVTTKEISKIAGPFTTPDILVTELEILSKLHHPRILMLLGICQDQCGSISLVFERVHMGSLYYVLHTNWKPLNALFVTDIVIQICEGLEYVHSQKMIHCAVTSHAIMLMENGQAKLSNFEYAAEILSDNSEVALPLSHPILASDTHVNFLRHWMAPEVLLKRKISTKIDVYSLTSVMWEMCYNELPWRDFSLQALRELFSQTQETLSINRKLTPTHWYHLLSLGLSVKKEDRDLEITEIRDMMILKKKTSAEGVGDCDSLWGSNKALPLMSWNSESQLSRMLTPESDFCNKPLFKDTKSSSCDRRKKQSSSEKIYRLPRNAVKVLPSEKHGGFTPRGKSTTRAFGTPLQVANRGMSSHTQLVNQNKIGKPPLPPQHKPNQYQARITDENRFPDLCELENKLNESKLLSSLSQAPAKPKRKWLGWNRPNKIDGKGNVVPLTSVKSSSSLCSSSQLSSFSTDKSRQLSSKSSSSSLLSCFNNAAIEKPINQAESKVSFSSNVRFR